MKVSMRALPPLLVTLAITTGCGWVDSTGRQSSESTVRVLLDDVPPGGALSLTENMIASIRPRAVGLSGEASYQWRDVSDAEGALDTCAGVEGFRNGLAAESFDAACTDANDCALDFEQIDGDTTAGVSFSLRVPPLKAPVGVRRTLLTTSLDSAIVESTYDLCLIAINEAPDAVDDGPYELVEGTTLIVGDDEPSLLANDSDDIDVGNQPTLTVNPQPVVPPSFATNFELMPDGGFRYGYANVDLQESLSDRFEYEVSDGVHTSRASVEVRIVVGNRQPVQDEDIPPIQAIAGEFIRVELGAGFSDPEGERLIFSVDYDQLPESRSLFIDRNGVLSGVPLPEDVGDYAFTLGVSDGEETKFADVVINILPPANRAPVYEPGSIVDVLIPVGRRITGFSAVFTDPDNDPLTHALSGEPLPRGLAIDPATGIIAGRPRERGIFRGVSIRATDPQGEFADSEPFTIRVF